MFYLEYKDNLQIKIPSTFKKYNIKKELGQGSFGHVFKVEDKDSHQFFAAKISLMEDDMITEFEKENITNEHEILSMISHQNIIKFYESFEIKNDDNQKLFVIILEYCSNGSLLDYVIDNKFKNKNEKKKMMRQIISAISYLHEIGIAHCDIKLENILIDEDFNIKLIDFGLSKNLYGKHNEEKQGSILYAAPELFFSNKIENFMKTDIWSLGVLLFSMSENHFPYENILEIFKIDITAKMKNKKLRKVIKKCFIKNPHYRPNASYLLNSNYLKVPNES